MCENEKDPSRTRTHDLEIGTLVRLSTAQSEPKITRVGSRGHGFESQLVRSHSHKFILNILLRLFNKFKNINACDLLLIGSACQNCHPNTVHRYLFYQAVAPRKTDIHASRNAYKQYCLQYEIQTRYKKMYDCNLTCRQCIGRVFNTVSLSRGFKLGPSHSKDFRSATPPLWLALSMNCWMKVNGSRTGK